MAINQHGYEPATYLLLESIICMSCGCAAVYK